MNTLDTRLAEELEERTVCTSCCGCCGHSHSNDPCTNTDGQDICSKI